MATVKAGDSTYEINRIDYGVHNCDKCGEPSGCMKSVKKLPDSKPVKFCYSCTGNHWKTALKIYRAEFEINEAQRTGKLPPLLPHVG